MHSRVPLELEVEDKASPIEAEEALWGTSSDFSPTIIIVGVLGTSEPEREFAESNHDEDGEGSSTRPIDEVVEDKDMGKNFEDVPKVVEGELEMVE